MMHALVLLHRWLGVAFCLLFAMWFASGMVMHFVPFPAPTEAERLAGLAPIDLGGVRRGPADAVAASAIAGADRVRLVERTDGPVYLISDSAHVAALHAADLSGAAVDSQPLALAIAADYASRRGWDAVAASVAAPSRYDQWTLAGGFDRHRPLYRVALNDRPGTELYVSSTTGEVVLTTARWQRTWNYFGSIAHWIYPTALRVHPAAWSVLLWWLSLLALIAAAAGAVVGVLRIGAECGRLVSPYGGMKALHHWVGLACMAFVLSFIFSGWLSMDDGRLFSSGKPAAADAAALAGLPEWQAMPPDELNRVAAAAIEVEWFAFGGRIHRRERGGTGERFLFPAGEEHGEVLSAQTFLRPDDIDAAARRLGRPCKPAIAVDATDDYAVSSTDPGAPVFRLVCGDDWFDIDGENGVVLEKLDSSGRSYRWLYRGLHTLDFPVLTARPALRATLIVGLCGAGLIFSLTGVVIAWRRLLASFRSSAPLA
jgi:hypothetical protein